MRQPTTRPSSPLIAFPRRTGRGAAGGAARASRSCARSSRMLPTRRCCRPAAQIERLRVFLEPVFARQLRRRGRAAARHRPARGARRRLRGRGRFLAELTLDPPSSTGDLAGPPLLDEDWLVLSTIHSAKGLEWDVVHVIHAADGMIPSDMATGDDDEIEEERRLLYVALTRARDALHVYLPMRYYRRPRGRPALLLAALALPRAARRPRHVRRDRSRRRRVR